MADPIANLLAALDVIALLLAKQAIFDWYNFKRPVENNGQALTFAALSATSDSLLYLLYIVYSNGNFGTDLNWQVAIFLISFGFPPRLLCEAAMAGKTLPYGQTSFASLLRNAANLLVAPAIVLYYA